MCKTDEQVEQFSNDCQKTKTNESNYSDQSQQEQQHN